MTVIIAAVGTQEFALPAMWAPQVHLAAETHSETVSDEKAPNPILPVVSEVFWNVGAFLVLVVLMKFVAYPAVKKAIDARNAKVEGDLAAAVAAKFHADEVLVDYQAKMAVARGQANAIIEEARQALEAVRHDEMAALNAELATLRAQSAEEIATAKSQALSDLQSGVTDLAVGAAERVVGRSIDRDAVAGDVEAYLRQAAEGTPR